MDLFRRFRKPITREDILNNGLGTAMAFGDNWLKSINERLGKKYSFLTEAEIIDYNSICQNAMQKGHSYIYDTLCKIADLNNNIKGEVLRQDFNHHMKNQFEWISAENLKALFSQGCYYAWKEGLDKAIVG